MKKESLHMSKSFSSSIKEKDFFENTLKSYGFMEKEKIVRDEKGFKTRIFFHRNIYKLKALKKAGDVFNKIAHVGISAGKPYHEVSIWTNREDSSISWFRNLAGSFINHALLFSLDERRK